MRMSGEHSSPNTDSTAYFRQLCDAAGVALLSVDCGLKVCYGNHKAAELLGQPLAALIGRRLGDVLQQGDGGFVERLAEHCIRYRETRDFELQHRDASGADCHWAVTLSPVPGPSDQVHGASLCVRDISRPIAVQQQLSQARKMRALAALAGNLAHHFNNILGGAVTRIDFAAQSNDLRVLKRVVRGTAEALQRSTHLLDGLLAFAEADYRDADLADLTETLLRFVDRLEPECQRRHIEFEFRMSQVPVIAVPMNQFMTVLSNVVDNALDALGPDGRLGLELGPGNGEVICRVLDNGPGIGREQIEHVFEPFFSTKSGSGHDGGTPHHGLGLSVALGIIHEMGGDMCITSSPGDSTVVEIRLPVDRNQPVHAQWSGTPGSAITPDNATPASPQRASEPRRLYR